MNQTKSVAQDITGKVRQLLVDVQGYSVAGVQVTGSWLGSITIEGSTNGQGWITLTDENGSSLTGITANNIYKIDISTVKLLRVRLATYVSGTAMISVLLNSVPGLSKSNIIVAMSGENLPLDTQGVTQKPVVSSSYSGQAFSDFGVNSNASVTTVPTMIKSIHAQNENAAIRYLQIFNLAAAPTDDVSIPIFSFAIPAGSGTNPGICDKGAEFFGEAGYYLSAGFAWGISVDPDIFDSTGVTVGEHQVNGIRV